MNGSRSTSTGTEDSTTESHATARLLIDSYAACITLSVCKRVLSRLTQSGAIPSFKIGKSRRYCPIELQAWVKGGCPTAPNSGDRIRKAARP
jgi:hypothetical protein